MEETSRCSVAANLISEQGLEDNFQVQRFLEDVPELTNSFDILRKIGEGTFSKVYQARKKETNEYYALKHIIPTSHPTRIASELKLLLQLGNKRNVIGLASGLFSRGNVVIVMPYFHHNRFTDYVLDLTFAEIQDYMKNLLISLEWIHAASIIHRDIKPSNFLFNRKSKRYALVDFGLAQKVDEINKPKPWQTPLLEDKNESKASLPKNSSVKRQTNEEAMVETEATKRPCRETMSRVLQPLGNRINVTVHPAGSDTIKKPTAAVHKQVLWKAKNPETLVAANKDKKCYCFGKKAVCLVCLNLNAEIAARAGTPGFRAPEVLMRHRDQTTAVDVWSAGAIFISLLSCRYPFFRATDDMTALAEMVVVFGTQRMKNLAAQLDKLLTVDSEKPAKDLGSMCHKFRNILFDSETIKKNDTSIPESAIALLYCLLDPDPRTRISAKNAMKHSFFSTKFV